MEIFAKLFGRLLVFVYHCFDQIVVNGYLSGLSRPEQVVYFFREVVGKRAELLETARLDPDLEPLRGNDEFHKMITKYQATQK